MFAIGLRSELGGEEPHRSPLAIAVCADTQVCLTANHTSGTVSLVKLGSMTVSCEVAVGQGPTDVVWLDGGTALVSLKHDDTVAVLKRNGDELTVVRTVSVGDEPCGLAVSLDQHRVYVATAGEDSVAVLDLDRLRSTDESTDSIVIDRLVVGGIPRTVVLSPDERWLVTSCAVPCELFVHDTQTLRQVSARKIFDGGFNPGTPAVTRDSSTIVSPSAVNRGFSVTAGMIDIGWVIDNRLSKLPLPDGEPSDQKQLGLDIRGKAVGDANAVAFSPDEHRIVVTCGGTHELLVIDFPSIDWPKGDPGDFLPESLRNDVSRFHRIKLGGRPVDVKFIDQQRLIVANYLDDSLQIIDLDSHRIVNTIALGGPREPGQIRRGEIVFYDADRSLHSWFSCHTCHTDGHTSGQVFDTRNDQSYGTPKLIPSLRGVAETGPWTWHGWQTNLKDAMRRSLQESMNTEHAISDDDVESITAYISTLGHPENPRGHAFEANAKLGRQLFEGKAGCAKCHSGPTFTSAETYDGAVEDQKDRNKQYNPPTLRGVSTRRRFLHTGKAKSLEQVLTKYHRPEDIASEPLSDVEVSAIIDFLKSI